MRQNKKPGLFAFSVRLFKIAAPVKEQLVVSTLASILGNMAQLTLMGTGAAWILCVAGILEGNPFPYGFIRLLLRFWEPADGVIKLNGIPLNRFTLEGLHRRIALLEQDTFLFDASIADNIALGKPDASREEIIEAAKKACIHEFILTLPDGYETKMRDMGDRLSGGERQRVGIARTLLMSPDVLVLDEPTSSLDILNEKSFLKMLEEAYADKTIIIVSHRMSTLAFCNRIFELKENQLNEIRIKENRTACQGRCRNGSTGN